MGYFLNQQQIDQYHQKGFIQAKKVYTAATVEKIRQLVEEDYESGQWHTAPYCNEHCTTDIYNRIPGLAELIYNENYIGICKDLFGEDCFILPEPAIHKNRYYFWHKDSTFLDEQGEDFHWQTGFQAAMTVLYLQPNHPQYGGGLTVVPETQHNPDLYHKIPKMSLWERDILKMQKIMKRSFFDKLENHPSKHKIPAEIGDVTFLDMRLDHKGTPALVPNVPYNKYGIMNFACKGKEAADNLSRCLRKRPSGYYQTYLLQANELGEKLEKMAQKHQVSMQL